MSIPGKEIFRYHDPFGPVSVFDDGNKRYLALGGDDQQSCQLKHQPAQLQYDYTRAMLLALLFKPQAKRTLLLGLGGGSLATCLHHHFADLSITAVELRPAVIDVAYQYFQLPRGPRLQVIEADANDYLQNNPPADFDIVFSDIYGSDGVNDLQLQERYLDQCGDCLSNDGWLVLNCWQQHRSEAAMMRYLKTRFADLRVCSTQSGNWVILAGRKKATTNDKQLRQKAKVLSAQLGFSLSAVLAKQQTL